ncbi:hypothetical protein EG328_004124 [Venturia inaequalis]|uniref:Nephrocystin 3-like N-terminal domain-containing protein n=1 Tax=Venturia inaequalis TaxID=5025 RepID=A0A8H3VGB5_VENIN|nr:hypothetical protein EG328_004124 [Venturia inaequalis]
MKRQFESASPGRESSLESRRIIGRDIGNHSRRQGVEPGAPDGVTSSAEIRIDELHDIAYATFIRPPDHHGQSILRLSNQEAVNQRILDMDENDMPDTSRQEIDTVEDCYSDEEEDVDSDAEDRVTFAVITPLSCFLPYEYMAPVNINTSAPTFPIDRATAEAIVRLAVERQHVRWQEDIQAEPSLRRRHLTGGLTRGQFDDAWFESYTKPVLTRRDPYYWSKGEVVQALCFQPRIWLDITNTGNRGPSHLLAYLFHLRQAILTEPSLDGMLLLQSGSADNLNHKVRRMWKSLPPYEARIRAVVAALRTASLKFNMETTFVEEGAILNQVVIDMHSFIEESPISQFSVEERFMWSERRETTKPEDKIYSLLGIFDVEMPLFYSEGATQAYTRLREMIDRREKCMQYLCVSDPRDDKKRIEETKGGLLKDSYCWILENSDFRQWHSAQQNALLWVKGDPGKGKTMLLCGVIDELDQADPHTSLLSYFFCQATNARINNGIFLHVLASYNIKQQFLLAERTRS